MGLRNYNIRMTDGGGRTTTPTNPTTTPTRSTTTPTRSTTTPTRSTTTPTTTSNNSGGFFSRIGKAISDWADKLVSDNPNIGKSGLDNPYNFVRPGDEAYLPVTAGGGVPTYNAGTASSAISQGISNSANNFGSTYNNSNTYTPPANVTRTTSPTNRSTTSSNSGTLDNNVGSVNRGSSGVITDLPIATQNPNPGTLFGQSLLDQLADIKGVNTEQGTSGTAESPGNAAAAKDQATTAQQAEKEQDAAAGLKALLNRWFYNPNAGKSGLDNPYNFVRPGREGDIGVTIGGGSPESITYPRNREPSYTGGGIGPVYSSIDVTPSGGSFWDVSPEAAAAYARATGTAPANPAPTIEQRIAEQAAGRQRREAAAQQQRIDDIVNGSFAGDWNAFNRAMRLSGINPQLVGDNTLRNAVNNYFNTAGTYSPFGGGLANDTAYLYEPGYGSDPVQTINGATTNINGTATFSEKEGSAQGDPNTYGYAVYDNLMPLSGAGFGSAESVLNGLITAGAPEGVIADAAAAAGLANPTATEEQQEENSDTNGGGGGGGGRGGRNSGTYSGGGNVATNNTTGEANDYLYTLPEVSNSVSGALLNRLLPSGYDYNYNARMQSRLGDLQAAEDYYRNSAIPTLQNVYQNQAANTLANYLQAIRANRQSGLTSGANRGAQLASEVQAMQSANKENSENLNNTIGTNLANMLATLTGKRATAGSDTAGELQPYTTSMDNALSQVLMYYLYGNAAAEVNNGGLRRQNTVNYTAV